MVAEFMVQPSSWIEQGITVRTVRGLRLYKFTDEHDEGAIVKARRFWIKGGWHPPKTDPVMT